MGKILLVEPDFPFPNKSKNKANSIHKNFVPIGLLKLGAYHKDRGDIVSLVRGNKKVEDINFVPDEILITTLFTYWSTYVWNCVSHYRKIFPDSRIKLGGIYATLHKDKMKFKELTKKYDTEIFSGIIPEAEKYYPDYSLIPEIDYHATHMMRGCIRTCSFCGTWKIEPELIYKNEKEILVELKKIGKNKVIFYDNNLLANPNIKNILNEFNKLRINNKPVLFESQSGFDGRLLENDKELAFLLKKARFDNIRIAWDNGLKDSESIKKQINILKEAGYSPKNISVFMIYNFIIPYEDMLKKIKYCYNWGVQITDCRNRPLELDYDNYNPHKRNGQPKGSFYIHETSGWTDKKIRLFRKSVRQHNIEIRYAKDKGLRYDKKMEQWSAINNLYKSFKLKKVPKMIEIENSDILKDRIVKLKKLRTFFEKTNGEFPNLGECSEKKLNKLLNHLFELKNNSESEKAITFQNIFPQNISEI